MPMSDSETYCRNCGSKLSGPYCSVCGQKDNDLHVPVKELASELVAIIPSFDERLFRTLRPLFTRPGFLTKEYLAGRRRQFISPFKLYFFVSVCFFLISSASDTGKNFININNSDKSGTGTRVGKDTVIISTGEENDLVNISSQDSSASADGFKRSFFNALKRMQSNPTMLIEKFKEYRPKIIFLLLPIFALLLKVFYIRSKHLYVKHLIFAFYFHAFIFCVLIVIDLLELTHLEIVSTMSGLLYFAIPTHLFYGLKRVYGQNTWKTLIKMSLLSVSYLVIFFSTILSALFIIVFTFF